MRLEDNIGIVWCVIDLWYIYRIGIFNMPVTINRMDGFLNIYFACVLQAVDEGDINIFFANLISQIARRFMTRKHFMERTNAKFSKNFIQRNDSYTIFTT